MDCYDFELDLPPEYCHYQDNGCEFADSCLDCPFPDCLYAEPGGKQRWLKTLRDKAVLRLFTDQGKTVKDLALMFGVSRRTIQLTSSRKAYLEGVTVARNLPAAEMVLGRGVAVTCFDEHNPKEAVVIAVYS